jgi:hypothetical protein
MDYELLFGELGCIIFLYISVICWMLRYWTQFYSEHLLCYKFTLRCDEIGHLTSEF